MNRRPSRSRGFTLIEVLIVIAILLALGGIVAVNMMNRQEEADNDLTLVQIQSFDTALELFRLDFKRYPTSDEGLAVLWNKDALEDEDEMARWSSAYMDVTPTDQWGNEWVYEYPGEIRGEEWYDIISPGPDKEQGTEDDLHNHMNAVDEDGELRDEFGDFSVPDDGAGSLN